MALKSPEQLIPPESIAENHASMDGYFGTMFALMRRALAPGGSEFGLGISLFSLVVSIRATQIAEIGRFKGFSTLCLASALKFLDLGWKEPQFNKQRPDVNYAVLEAPPAPRRLFSVDPYPTEEAAQLIKDAALTDYVVMMNQRSEELTPNPGAFDLVFIDGDHAYEACRADVARYVPAIRPGGYFVLHDYFGWYDSAGTNNSPVKKVIDEVIAANRFEHVLIDTGYQSFVIFRK